MTPSDIKAIAPFDLILPTRLRFGRGEALAAVPDILALGGRILLVRGKTAERTAGIRGALLDGNAALHEVVCKSEPDLDMLVSALESGRAFGPDVVLAVGGGAVLDLGKALAALLPASDPDPMEHLEVVGRGNPLVADPLPFVAVPTTAGTGAEATRNAVIGIPKHRRKVSLRDPRMMADIAIVDPSFTDGSPPAVTFSSGLDAVTQVIEPYLSVRANPFTDTICRDAIPRGFAALARLVTRGEDPRARDDLSLVAYMSGMALSNAGLGAVHGIAGVLGGETGAPHGAICGQLLPPVLCAIRDAAPAQSVAAQRIAEVDHWCEAATGCTIEQLSDWAHAHGLPAPDSRLTPEETLRIAENSRTSSSMKPSPVEFSVTDLAGILRNAGWA